MYTLLPQLLSPNTDDHVIQLACGLERHAQLDYPTGES